MCCTALLCVNLVLGADLESEGIPLPGCGIAAVHSFLRCQGRAITLQDVDRAVRDKSPGVDPFSLSVADVRRALAAFGEPTRAVRVDPQDMASLPNPSVLFFGPGRWPRGAPGAVGHYVTLVKVSGRDAVLLDWNAVSVQSAVSLPLAQLETVWDGEAIVPDLPWWRSSQALAGFLVAICGSAICALARLRRGRTKSCAPAIDTATLSVLLLVVTCFVGCNRPQTDPQADPTPTLFFEKPMLLLGPVPGGRTVEEDFPFRVWERGPVTIAAFESSCGCATPDTDLVGKELPSGSAQSMRVRLRPDGEGLSVTRLIKIHTTPVSAGPLTVGIQYRRQDPPRISTSRIVASVAPGSIANAEVGIVYRHPPREPRVSLDLSRSAGTHFGVESVTQTSEVVKFDATADVDLTIDTTHVNLRALTRLPYGEHRGQIKFAFDDRSEQIVETLVSVPHPLRLQMPRVFCGFLTPGERWSRSIAWERMPGAAFEIASVRAEDDTVQAYMSISNRLELTGEAPRAAGRFEVAVIVKFVPATIPPLRVPVSGIVRNDSK